MSYQPPPLPAQLSVPMGLTDAQGVVTSDLPCRKCSYNLRGLPADGRCPECGAAVGLSVQGDLLRFADPQWVRGLQRGVRLIIWGVVIVVLGSILAGALSAALAGTVQAMQYALLAAPLAGYILILVGTWRLTEPDPSGIGEDQYGTARRLIRITLILGIVEQVIEVMQETVTVPPAVSMALLALALVFAVAGIVHLFAQLQYLRKLALRIPDLRLAGRAHFLMYAMGISYGLLAVVGIGMAIAIRMGGPNAGAAVVPVFGCFGGIMGLAVLVFAIMYLLMLERMGKQFGEQAQLAEQTWARVEASGVQTAPLPSPS